MGSKAKYWLHHCFFQFLNITEKKLICIEVLVFESNKLYNLYTEKRQLNYFKPKAQETLKAYNDI